jgi:hypothetical protein
VGTRGAKQLHTERTIVRPRRRAAAPLGIVRRHRPEMPGKRVQFDEETWQALDLLARDQMKTFQELADEAFADLLKKNNRPANLKDALRKSAGHSASVHQLHPTRKKSHAKR